MVPPIEKQQAIATRLDSVCATIENSIKNEGIQITLLSEYRTSLISDVVTGKLDVRSVAVPEYEAVEETATDTDDGDIDAETEETGE